jgi:MFS family permease
LRVPRLGEPPRSTRQFLLELGLPTFALAFAISIVTTYAPVVLIGLDESPSQIGVLIGAEGAFALVVPLLSGVLSDRLRGSPRARRFPFVLAGAPVVVTALAILPFSGSVGVAAGCILAFFVGYYVYYPPYRALYGDLLAPRWYARAQASQAILRGAGLGAALLAGGVLLPLWLPLPFAVAAATVGVTTFALALVLRAKPDATTSLVPLRTPLRQLLLRNRALRVLGFANALWEFAFSGLKSFIVLYVVRGLGHSTSVASAVIAVVAVAYVVGAPLAGRLADRYGIVRVLRVSALVYGVGFVVATFPTTLTPLLIGLPFVAIAGAIVMTLPPALVFTLAPVGSAGAAGALVDISRGVGTVLGPIAVGSAVQAFRGVFVLTHGYAAMWPVVGVPVLASVLLLRRLPAEAGATTPS